jgi:hypothetical protein
MGFTRYWEFNSLDTDKFKDFSTMCQIIVESMDIPVEDVTINERQVRFNGVEEDGHETFVFSIDKTGFNFCKTNTKPYDELVCGCLHIAKLLFGENIRVNQDCETEDDEMVIRKVMSILREKKLSKILDEKSLSNKI